MRINSSVFSGQGDYSGSISRVSGSKGIKAVSTVQEDNPTIKDFKKAVGKDDFDHIVGSIQSMSEDLKYTRLEFEIHADTKRVMVKIYDRNSDELISEVPPEKFLDLLAGLWEQAGLIVDEKV